MAFKNAKVYGDFYSPEITLSYGKPWIFSLGNRNAGKSTGWSIHLILMYMKKGHKFIYVRRTEDELLMTCNTFFDNAITILNMNGYEIVGFKYEKRNYYIDLGNGWEQCGVAVPLSFAGKVKSTNYQDYFWIIYDEFLAMDSTGYLGKVGSNKEYLMAISLYQTVDRGIGKPFRNETTFIFIANPSTFYNPIFIELGIDKYIRTDSKIISPKNALWIVELVSEVKAMKELKEAYAYKLSTQSVKGYAYENITFDNDNEFIEKINAPMKPILNVKFSKHHMGLYYVPSIEKVYVSDKTNNCETLALTVLDQDKINYKLVEKFNNHFAMKTLKDCASTGDVIYQNAKCKYDITNYLMLTY